MSECKYVVKAVSTLDKRDEKMLQIYSRLREENLLEDRIKIIKDGLNKISVYHTVPGTMDILLRVYLVIVIPINIDLSALSSLHGKIYFDLQEPIDKLSSVLRKLKSIEGERTVTTPLSAKRDLEATLNQLLS